MATHVIELDLLNPLSILRADYLAKQYAAEFDRKVDTFINELAEVGAKAASGAYGSAVAVSVERTEDGAVIHADGDAVVFMEFGAGSMVDRTNRYTGVVEEEGGFPVRRGSYSDSKNPKGEYARTGYKYWHFGSVVLEYIEPRSGMSKAHDAMIADMKDVAQRVFGT